MSNKLITLRGGRQIRRWVFIGGSVLISLSTVVLISHRNSGFDVVSALGIVLGLAVVWAGSSKRNA